MKTSSVLMVLIGTFYFSSCYVTLPRSKILDSKENPIPGAIIYYEIFSVTKMKSFEPDLTMSVADEEGNVPPLDSPPMKVKWRPNYFLHVGAFSKGKVLFSYYDHDDILDKGGFTIRLKSVIESDDTCQSGLRYFQYPFLPIKTYDKIDEVIDYINLHERPLALYIYSNNKKVQEKLLTHTMSGGVSINDCAMHVGQHDMPFGGVGNSGMGQYHGLEGFMEFSKMRPVFKQAKRALSLAPPYGDKIDRIYNFVTKMKWIS